MFRSKILKTAKLNCKLYSQIIILNKPVKPYEVAESEEIDIRINEEEKTNTNTNTRRGEATIYME